MRTDEENAVVEDMLLGDDIAALLDLTQSTSGTYDFEFGLGSFDALIAAALQTTWNNGVAINGRAPQPFTFEEAMLDASPPSYHRFAGSFIETLALKFAGQSVIEGSIGLKGSREIVAHAPLTGASYQGQGITGLVPAASMGNINLAWWPEPVPPIANLALQIKNPLSTVFDVTSLFGRVISAGKAEITGSISAYFDSSMLYEQVLAHARAAISFSFGAAPGEEGWLGPGSVYRIVIPNAQFTDGEKVIGGKNDSVMANSRLPRAVRSRDERLDQDHARPHELLRWPYRRASKSSKNRCSSELTGRSGQRFDPKCSPISRATKSPRSTRPTLMHLVAMSHIKPPSMAREPMISRG